MKSLLIAMLLSATVLIATSCNKNPADPDYVGTYGYFTTQTEVIDSVESTFAAAVLLDNPGNTGITVSGGNVTLNGQALVEEPTYHSYSSDGNDFNLRNGVVWQVSGSSTVKDFTYNHSSAHPAFTGILPDTIDIVTGVIIPVQSIHADSVSFSFTGFGLNILIEVPATQNTVTITPAMLANALPDDLVQFETTTYSSTIANLNGKDYEFLKSEKQIKFVYLQ